MKLYLHSSVLAAAFALSVHSADSPRQHLLLDDDWKFIVADPTNAAAPDFADANWRTVMLPHDWSIGQAIDAKAPMGGGGGFYPAGIGWYRRHFSAPSDWRNRRVLVEFEGVYMNATVYLNGQKLAFHPYGYTSFFADLTPALHGGADNVLAVRVDNSQQKNSRWYSGSGIYRHVWLDVLDPVHVAPWGVFVSVPKAGTDAAQIVVQTELANESTALDIRGRGNGNLFPRRQIRRPVWTPNAICRRAVKAKSNPGSSSSIPPCGRRKIRGCRAS